MLAHPNHFSALVANKTFGITDWRFIMPALGTMDLATVLKNADELDRLHGLKIVHGDISLMNFRVSKINDKYFVYAIDFGLTHYEGEEAKSLMGRFRAFNLKQKTIEKLQQLTTSYIESDEYQEYEDHHISSWVLQHSNFAPETIDD
jgi:tRNA A-37 threonylcarbamoyl transferase component Bud32